MAGCVGGIRRESLCLVLKERTGVTPPTLNHCHGQREAVALLRTALEAAWNDAGRLPHTLLTGPPGVGKTMFAHLAAREMAVTLHERLGQTLDVPAAVNGLLMQAADKDVVFIDEAHELPPASQTVLYRAVDDRILFVRTRGDRTLTLPVADFTLVLATTDEYGLLQPLRDRCKLLIPFSWYDVEDLCTIVTQRATMMAIDIDSTVAEAIAARAKQTPRLAIRLLESCHRYARSRNDHRIEMDHFTATVELERIDSLGLSRDERRYLSLLAEKNGEPVRLITAESALGLHRRTLQTVIEPYLIRAGLCERLPTGRAITAKGLRHLEECQVRSEVR
jgi:Holliday junction DNA helicase RuvB